MSETAHTPYSLLRLLINRVGWPSEDEKRAAIESVDSFERVNLFGNLATMMECRHEYQSRGWQNAPLCIHCGRRQGE